MTSIVWLTMLLATLDAPPDWSCDVERWGDGICDCACTAADDIDCSAPCPRDNNDNNDDSDDSGDGPSCAQSAGAPWAWLALLLRRRRPR